MGIFQQKYITEQEDTTTPEHTLWISVLSKAAHDAIFTSDWVEARKAMNWFKDQGAGFREVCELAGKDPNYVHSHIINKILEREKYMIAIRNGNRVYVKDNPYKPRGGKVYHSHYRAGQKRGPYKKKKKHLSGNSYYAAKRKKDPYYVKIGKLGGRPRLYDRV